MHERISLTVLIQLYRSHCYFYLVLFLKLILTEWYTFTCLADAYNLERIELSTFFVFFSIVMLEQF